MKLFLRYLLVFFLGSSPLFAADGDEDCTPKLRLLASKDISETEDDDLDLMRLPKTEPTKLSSTFPGPPFLGQAFPTLCRLPQFDHQFPFPPSRRPALSELRDLDEPLGVSRERLDEELRVNQERLDEELRVSQERYARLLMAMEEESRLAQAKIDAMFKSRQEEAERFAREFEARKKARKDEEERLKEEARLAAIEKERLKIEEARLREESRPIFLNLFWTTGGIGRTLIPAPSRVLIGGQQEYADIFVLSMRDFLTRMRTQLSVTFVCDDLTYQTNKVDLDNLSSEFKGRFLVRFVGDVLNDLKKVHPSYAYTLDAIFENAEFGNPAIASDVFRLLLRSIYKDAPAEALLVYTDADLFSGYNNTAVPLKHEIYAENLCSPTRVGRHQNNNDFIKFIKQNGDEGADLRTLDHFQKLLARGPTVINHCSTLLCYLESYDPDSRRKNKNIFAQYLLYARQYGFNIKQDIISVTGPRSPALSITGLSDGGLDYPLTEFGASWFDPMSVAPEPSSFTKLIPLNSFDRFVRQFNLQHPKVLNITPEESRDTASLMKTPKVLLIGNFGHLEVEGFPGSFIEVLGPPYTERIKATILALRTKYQTHRAILSDLGWLKRFGEHHPFCRDLRATVIQFFDLRNNPDFQELLRIYYEYDLSQRGTIRYTSEEWADLMAYQLAHLLSGTDLLHSLTKTSRSLGINPLTRQDIQEIID